MALADSVLEVSASTKTGAPAVFALRKRGSAGKSLGRSTSAALMAACTSRAALSMLRPMSNWSWMFAVPSDEVEVIWLMPAISPSRRSSGAATVAAITEGSAPGRLAETKMAGKSTFGTEATGRNS